MQFVFNYDNFNSYDSERKAEKNGKPMSTKAIVDDMVGQAVPHYQKFLEKKIQEAMRGQPVADGEQLIISVNIGDDE